MSDEKTLASGECQHTSYHLPKWDDNGKVYWDEVLCQDSSLNAKAIFIKPPTKVIPVIFIPGVMGSNLKSSQEGKDKAIWRGDSEVGVYAEWARKDGNQRRELLNPETTNVDNRGNVSKKIYSKYSDDGKSANGKMFQSRQERGWGEVLSFSYGEFLSVFQGALMDDWQQVTMNAAKQIDGKNGVLSELRNKRLADDKGAEITNESVMTDDELSHFKKFLFPVHVFGYNWLQDNKTSAGELVTYIDKVINTYKYHHGHGMPFPEGQEKVIIVTHSMGGLVARYAMNPPEEATFHGCENKVLGIVHGVIPDLGSPAAYRRMKIGAKQEGMAGIVLGKSAEELMPVLARAPAPLQLLPSEKYISGAPWLTIKSGNVDGSDLKLPKNQDPFTEIYLNKTLWWRLYESNIIDKDNAISEVRWEEYFSLIKDTVQPFTSTLEKGRYHRNTYAFYGNKIESDGLLIWRKTSVTYPKDIRESDKKLPNDYRDIPLQFNRSQVYQLISSKTPGDGTVPVESLSIIRHYNGIKSVLATNVDHQGAYNVSNLKDIHSKPAIQFTLRAIVKMVQEVAFP
ncbi:lipase family alpha/beta hydrolase [Yersinia frederiksenii]|uniref:lipase family alpha/beta hydrolase n=1 Tax=Yersinia frederiksenii TaxID=29484 RepID=UPI0016439BAC|nr:acetyltransferase [Yersinia frederiksenii]MDN0118311.1 acetyltransferase [Yersinia frederiksenii]